MGRHKEERFWVICITCLIISDVKADIGVHHNHGWRGMMPHFGEMAEFGDGCEWQGYCPSCMSLMTPKERRQANIDEED